MHKILLVEDEPNIITLLTRTIATIGCADIEILTAENGKIGLDIIKKERPEIVFLDIMMPEMNGYELCKIVKKDLEMTDVNIVMLTAKGQKSDEIKGKDAGADSYITKPFKPNEIRRKISEVCKITIE
ncbi:MAG: response regulator [Nitrospirae bacterium]|nr:response regulator [Nitrospirota bacterium]